MTELHVVVTGRVQGVGFRWFVREKARRWGLLGWVRNRPDGSVEVAASGAPENLNGLLRDIRCGPPGARVDGVEHLEPSETAVQEPFSILK
jgi:acylphosphatase